MPRTQTKHQDVRLKEIEVYITEGKYMESVLADDKRALRKISTNFTMIGKEKLISLYHIGFNVSTTNYQCQVAVSLK